jgi:catechol 2,3-dioxygenase-like lactoylglutathione lyase family enzyme
MPLCDLVDLELTVPDPGGLVAFWERLGMVRTDPSTLGTGDRPSQLRIAEGPYRYVSELRLACTAESDLVDIAARLERLGVPASTADGVLVCHDPLADHAVVVEVGRPPPLTAPPARRVNGPGRIERANRRSPVSVATAPVPPRRVGHVVFGSPDVAATVAFYRDGLGFKVSDVVDGGIGCFLRCSTDHHNLLVMPAPVPCLNHYAMEMDDIDAIGLAGTAVVAGRPDASVYGPGRHVLGANLYWYLLDPAGGMFELFADMDQITDDGAWQVEERRDDWDPFTIAAWEPGPSKPDFFLPADIDDLARARVAAGR